MNHPSNGLRQRAVERFQQGDADGALRLLRQAADLDPHSALAWNDFGTVLAQCGRLAEAIPVFRRAIELAPDTAEAHNNLANLYQMTGALEEAVTSYGTALRIRPEYAEAHRNLASALRRLGRLEESVAALATAVALNPAYAEAAALLIHQLQSMCDWRSLDDLTAQLIRAVESGSGVVNPFIFVTLRTTARQQRMCAGQWARRYPVADRPPLRANRERLHIGYLSADFQDHATAHLISELIELHDRARFHIIGYSYGEDDGSGSRRRLRDAFDSFVDLQHASHAEAAARIRGDEVDILVDLKGYTTDARPEILALRPAPIQVSYLGYPGTMGCPAIDYILVDEFVVPADQQPNFTEKLAYLPHCYQVNDRTRLIAPAPARAECGLPEQAFVFCCFNSPHKITPEVFEIWMRLLDRVPDSVLWLLDSNPHATANLRAKIGTERVVFAPSLPNPLHLARFAAADLFLDTLPYNAHTLSSDALWGGCPVLTCAGETFASRVAGSILRAVNLPELVTSSLPEYEDLAFQLATDRGKLSALRTRLRADRPHLPLFDTPRFARDIEAAFERMLTSA